MARNDTARQIKSPNPTFQKKKATEHPYLAIEHRIFDSPAFADLKPSSVRVLLAIARQLTVDYKANSRGISNNGHLQCAFSWCQRYGIASDNTVSSAIADLIAHGFICRTKSHGANGVWAEYAVTWLPIQNHEGIFTAGFKQCAWRDWSPPAKKTLPQKLRNTSLKNCDLRGGFPAKSAGSLTAKSATYEHMVPCYKEKHGRRNGDKAALMRWEASGLIRRQVTGDRGLLRVVR